MHIPELPDPKELSRPMQHPPGTTGTTTTPTESARSALLGAAAFLGLFVAERMYFQAAQQTAHERLVDAHRAADTIALADERLTMSAHMVAATGEQRWIKRYEANIPLIDEAIERAAKIAPDAVSKRFELETKVSNDRLVELERQSFVHASAGSTSVARGVLDSELYDYHKQVLADGTQRFVAGTIGAVASDLQRLTWQSIILLALGFAAALTAMLSLWRRLERSISQTDAAYRDGEARTRHLAMSDFLTNLPNRLALRDQLRTAIGDAERDHRQFIVMMVDLDRFKPINDRYGHISGDHVLKIVAQRIAAFLAPGEICARYGGDEFVVISTCWGSPDVKLAQGMKLIESLNRPIVVDGQMVQVGASIGIASYPADGTSEDKLLRHADLALYRAKQSGRGLARLFSVDMDIDAGARLAAEEEIRGAIAGGQIIPYFQPIVDVASRQIRGFEALARWQHPTRGIVAPIDFIPVAEAAGELANLTMSMLRQACIATRDLPAELTLAVNISPQQIQDEWLSTKILKVLTETGFPPHRLEIELTENALVTDFTAAKRVIQSLKNLGIGVALDDFGTGYSSLYYLSELQFDKIKIDRSFVRTLHERSESAKIINAIIGLGRSLGVPTMAEGVETERDAKVLGDIGCLTAQGYLYSRPVPADQLLRLLQAPGAGLKTASAA